MTTLEELEADIIRRVFDESFLNEKLMTKLLRDYGGARAAEMRERCEQACRRLYERGSGRENIAWSIPWQSGVLDAAAALAALAALPWIAEERS